MLFDFNEVTMVGGVMTFPDFPYANLPTQDVNLIEVIPILGTTGGVSPTGTGTIDD